MRWLLVAAVISAALLLGSNKLLGLRHSSTDFDHSTLQAEVHSDDAADPAEAACKLEFVRYISSAWEQQWAKNANKWSATELEMCRKVEQHKDHIAAWVQGVGLSQQGCGPFHPYLAEHKDTFSSFMYRDSCTRETTQLWIEPLAILTRHPEAFCMSKDALVDRGYLTFGLASDACAAATQSEQLQSAAKLARPDYTIGGRLLIFDLGASFYNSGTGGASQVRRYTMTSELLAAVL
jgi:hypothetical protein